MTNFAVNRTLDHAQGAYLDEIVPKIIEEVGSEHQFGYVPILQEGSDEQNASWDTTVIPSRSILELISKGVYEEQVHEILEMDIAGNTPLVVGFGYARMYHLQPDRFYAFDRTIVDHAVESGVALEKVRKVEKVAIKFKWRLPQSVAPASLAHYLRTNDIKYFRDDLADFERIWVLPSRDAESVVKEDAITIARLLRKEMPAVLFHKAVFGSDTNPMIVS